MSICIVCGKNKATIPDRNSMSRRNKVCIDCHRKRLAGDVQHIINDMNREMFGKDADYIDEDIGNK